MDISVIIPSRGREGLLHDLLKLLSNQQDPPDFEVLVVEDEPERTYQIPVFSFPLRHLPGGGHGPAHARNIGVREARGNWVLFLDDDVVPAAPDFLARLHRIIQSLPGAGGIQGQVRWHPEVVLNAFRWWLDHGGPQFAFFRLKHGEPIPGRFVTTACFALPREIALRFPFDERFPFPAYEDWDLGVRLEKARIPLIYREDIVVLHRSQPALDAYVERARKVGWSRKLLVDKHPELRTLPERVPGGILLGRVLFGLAGRVWGPPARWAENLPPSAARWVGWLFAVVYRRAFFEGYGGGRPVPPP